VVIISYNRAWLIEKDKYTEHIKKIKKGAKNIKLKHIFCVDETL